MHAVSLPLSYWLAVLITLGATAYGFAYIRRPWAPPFLAVLGTFFMWYLVEPIYAPDTWSSFKPEHISTAYSAASLFIFGFVIFFFFFNPFFKPAGTNRTPSLKRAFFGPGTVPPERLALFAIGLWLVLLAIGTYRLNGDLLQALFPTDMRSGVRMWQRYAGARAGPTGFLVSMGNYLYTLVLSSFGLLLVLARKNSIRMLIFFVILVSWPYVFLLGGRNIVLAVTVPLFAGFFLFSRVSLAIKLLVLVVAFLGLEFAMRAIIAMRNTGFDPSMLTSVEGQQHLGLDMGSELIWITSFIDSGRLQPNWGERYFAELVNFVPRGLWPGKPLIGIDYAIMRGYGGANNDIGVVATISTGMIGQGIYNFGMWAGSLAAALIMALWANFLYRLRLQATAPRIALFLIGLALTFNLGRDITLLVLFPFVFGYVATRIFEWRSSRKRSLKGSRRTPQQVGTLSDRSASSASR